MSPSAGNKGVRIVEETESVAYSCKCSVDDCLLLTVVGLGERYLCL